LFPAASAVATLLTVLHWRSELFLGFEASFDPLNVILNLLMIRSRINGVMVDDGRVRRNTANPDERMNLGRHGEWLVGAGKSVG
jgi:hypothetical protein